MRFSEMTMTKASVAPCTTSRAAQQTTQPCAQAVARYGAAIAVMLMGGLLALTGALLLLSVEHMPDMPSRWVRAWMVGGGAGAI